MKNKNIIKNKKGGDSSCLLPNGITPDPTKLSPFYPHCLAFAAVTSGIGAVGTGIGDGVTYGMKGISNQFQKGIYTGSQQDINYYSNKLGGQHVSAVQAGKLKYFNLEIPQQIGHSAVINIFPGKTLIFMGYLHPGITGIDGMGGVIINKKNEKEVYLADDGFFYLNKNFWTGQHQRCLLSDNFGIKSDKPTFNPIEGYNFCIWYSSYGHAPEGAGKNMNKKIINKKPTTKKTVLTKNPTTKKTSSTKKPTTKKTVLTKKPTTKKTSSTKNPTTKKTSSTKKPTTKKN